MIDYSKWKESKISVPSLMLDPSNPRIPESGENPSQRELIAALVENDKVYELAKSIVDNGYYPIESLIFVEEQNKKYVVEGNRRLAALKLLISPEMAPDSTSKRRFKALANRIDQNTIRRVKVIKAPTREEAAPVIMSRHTHNQIESWLPLMQDKFYRNLIDQGLTVDEVAEQYNIASSKITDALQRHMMYSIACALNLPNEVEKKVHNPREFPLTNLERLYKNPNVIQFLGISFDKTKGLIGSIDVEEFKKGYTKIITDIATKKEYSRSLNTKEAIDKYLKSFGDQAPNLGMKGNFTEDTFLDSKCKPPRSTPLPPIPPIKKPKPKPIPRALIPESFSCDVRNQRINDVFNELKSLPIAQYPNAVALMFRSLLEMSISYFLEYTGNMSKLKSKHADEGKKGRNPSDDWNPSLKQMLQYIVEKNSNIINNANLLKALRKVISEDNLVSIDTLNMLVHNQFYYPNESNLREFWSQMQGLFEIILVDPNLEDKLK